MQTGQCCMHCCTRIENLHVNIGNTCILHDINLHLNCHEILAVVGPNGAGKSTLLKAILGEIPYSGKIVYRTRNALNRQPRIGYVPQRINIDRDSPTTVQDFMAISLQAKPVFLGVSKRARKAAETALELTQATHLLDCRLGTLSGGELQRVLLASAMTPVPDLLLLDEPVSGVDMKGLQLFYELVNAQKNQHDISIIVVTHDVLGVSKYADRMALLNRSILVEGIPETVLDSPLTHSIFNLSIERIAHHNDAPHSDT